MNRPILATTLIGVSLICGAARATESDLPTVTITRIKSTGTWLDFLGNKPDFFARIRLRDSNGVISDCGSSSTNHDLLTALPNETLCSRTRTEKIQRPYWVLVEVYDADGPGIPEGQGDVDQADINHSPTRRDAELGPFSSGLPTQRSFTVSGPDAEIDVTVSTTPWPTKFTAGPYVTPDALDPVLGQSVFFNGELDDPTPLSIQVIDRRSGGVVWGLRDVPIQTMFNLGWDGREWPGGPLIPYGLYDVSIFGPPGAPRAVLPLELRPTPPLKFEGVALRTPNLINVRAIHPLLGFTIAQSSDVTLSITRADPYAKCSSVGVRTIQGRFPAGSSLIEWDGRDDSGAFASGGVYCLFLMGESTATHARFGTTEDVLQHVEDPRPIFVDVRTSPEIPSLFPGAPITVLARAFDHRGEPRPVNALTVEAAQFSPGGATSLVTLGTCRGVASCSFPLPKSIVGTAALRASGEDEKGALHTSTGVRLVDLVQPPNGADVRVSVAADLVDGAMVREVRRTNAIDIAFHRTSVYPVDGPGRLLPAAAVGRAIDSLLGYGHPSRGTSEMQRNMHATSFWFVPEAAQVEQSGSPADPVHNFCRVVYERPSTTANVNVILHEVDCRDLAFPNRVTANTNDPSVVWHEVHHSPFELYDEYCCDGGYWTRSSEPNVYANLGDCRASGSDPAGCSEIANPTATPPVFKGIYISDPAPSDVMNNEGPENADDLRRVRGQYATCANGGC